MDDFIATTEVLLEIEVQEAEAHKKVWGKRGGTIKKLQRAAMKLDDDVSTIIAGKGE